MNGWGVTPRGGNPPLEYGGNGPNLIGIRGAKQWLRSIALGVLTAVIGVLLSVTPVGLEFERIVGLPWLFQIRGPLEPPPDAVVVGINDTTGEELGLAKWPRDWPRTIHADLTEKLVEAGASVIVFDMDFNRPKEEGDDKAFGAAIARADRVVLFEQLVGKRQPLLGTDGSINGWVWVEEPQEPVKPLAVAAKARGPFPLPKLGAAVYQFWAFKSSAWESPTTAALAVQLHSLPFYDDWLRVLERIEAAGVEKLPRHPEAIRSTKDFLDFMSLQRNLFEKAPRLHERISHAVAEMAPQLSDSKVAQRLLALASLYDGPDDRFINFYGPPGTIPTIGYQTVLGAGKVAAPGPEAFRNKVVFVGYSDIYNPGQPDRFYSVFTSEHGVDLSGVEIMATAFANLLTDRTLEPIGAWEALILLGAFGLLLGVLVYRLPAIISVPLALLIAAGYATGAQWLFNEQQLWLPMATPMLVQLPFALLLGLMGHYLLERRKERQIAKTIAYYLPEHVVRDLTEGELDPSSVNRVVYGTCLATDMSGFTTISESKTPEELATFMNAYFDAIATSLKQHHVDVTEFHADTIMCAWTAQRSQPAVRRNAVLAAVDLAHAIDRFSEEGGGLGLRSRVGLDQGNFFLGHTGGGGHFAYSILGDPANTASRLEGLNKHLGTHILATSPVLEGLDNLLLRPMGDFFLVGKDAPTPVVEVIARLNEASEEQLDLTRSFGEALELFRQEDWAGAAESFAATLERHAGDGASRFYLVRCRRFERMGAPEELPSVIRMTSK